MKQKLYLLVDSNDRGFKIGVSLNPFARANSLPQEFDWNKSLQIDCSKIKAVHLEKSLHRFFSDYRDISVTGDGHTEWFKIEALPLVVSFINTNTDLFGSCLSAIERPIKPTIVERPSTPTEAWDESQAYEHNREIFERLSSWIEEARSNPRFVGFFRRNGYFRGCL